LGNSPLRRDPIFLPFSYPGGANHQIDFVSNEEIELNAKDMFAFSYLENKLKLVQNLTVRRYYLVLSSGCFVATYMYGSDSKEVVLLRRFRDDVLLKSLTLSFLVILYYRISPTLLRRLEDKRVLRPLLLVLTKPFLMYISFLYQNRGLEKVKLLKKETS